MNFEFSILNLLSTCFHHIFFDDHGLLQNINFRAFWCIFAHLPPFQGSKYGWYQFSSHFVNVLVSYIHFPYDIL